MFSADAQENREKENKMKRQVSILVAVLILAAALSAQVPPIIKTQTVELRIQAAPSFNMTVTPPMITTFVGRTVAYSVDLESVNDFAGVVVIEATGLPAGIVVTYFPSNSVTLAPGPLRSVQVNIEIPTSTVVGTYQVTFTATSENYN